LLFQFCNLQIAILFSFSVFNVFSSELLNLLQICENVQIVSAFAFLRIFQFISNCGICDFDVAIEVLQVLQLFLFSIQLFAEVVDMANHIFDVLDYHL
jgi:hypothetical protein